MPDFSNRTAAILALYGALFVTPLVAHAQAPTLPQDRPGERVLPIPETETQPAPEIKLPPVDLSPGESPLLAGPRVRLSGVRFVGNTAFSDTELALVVAPYVGREIGAGDLEAMRLALTKLYLERGFINSGAVVPDQEISGGVITLRLVEGTLSDIHISGNRRLSDDYLRERVRLDAGPPVNVYAIRDRLFVLQQDPRIRRLRAALLPGLRPGEAVLRLDVEEQPSRSLYLGINNYRPPTVGAERAELEYTDRSLFASADTLALRYGLTRGIDDVDLNYAFPVSARDTALTLRYARSDAAVVEAPFDTLDVESETESAGFGVWHPYLKTPRREYAVGLTLERRRSQTFLLGEPFAFTPGADAAGISRVTAYRLLGSWLTHDPSRIVAGRSILSVGTGALHATVSDSETDGRFTAWLGQMQWIERFTARREELVVRADAQLASDPLLSLEQFPIGGAQSVRVYRENQLVRDRGLLASVEYRWPLGAQGESRRLQLAAFFDYGRSWNRERPTPGPRSISSIGAGVRGAYAGWLEYQLYVGVPLRDVENPDDDLQDDGIHFQLRAQIW